MKLNRIFKKATLVMALVLLLIPINSLAFNLGETERVNLTITDQIIIDATVF